MLFNQPLPPHPSLPPPPRAHLQEGPACIAHLSVPLHARYPRPQNGSAGWAGALLSAVREVQVPQPLVLTQCQYGEGAAAAAAAAGEARAEEEAAARQRWVQAYVTLGGALPVWRQPAGSLAHAALVPAVTAAAMLAGAAAVLGALFRPLAPANGRAARRGRRLAQTTAAGASAKRD